jgi:N-formylglutamate amidohydrolase
VGVPPLFEVPHAGTSSPAPMAQSDAHRIRRASDWVECFRCMRFSLNWTHD